MPSPVTAENFQISSFGGDICENLRKLLELNNTLKTFFEWFLDADGNPSSEFVSTLQQLGLGVPIGAMVWRPLNAVPVGYLIANGQAVSRTTYANLFAVYGITFGAGDGTTTFNLPSLQARFPLGKGPGGTYNVGTIGGELEHTLTTDELAAHQHDAWAGAVRWLGGGASTNSSGTYANVQGTHVFDIKTELAGGGQAHNNMPPYMAGLWLIKT